MPIRPGNASKAAIKRKGFGLRIRRVASPRANPPAATEGIRPHPFWDNRALRSRFGRLLQPSTWLANDLTTVNSSGSGIEPDFCHRKAQVGGTSRAKSPIRNAAAPMPIAPRVHHLTRCRPQPQPWRASSIGGAVPTSVCIDLAGTVIGAAWADAAASVANPTNVKTTPASDPPPGRAASLLLAQVSTIP
jgi:hypothetical protein